MMRIVYCGLISGALAASPSLATTYQCVITKRTMNNTWIAPKITIYHDEASGSVRIDDANVREVWDSPMPGKVVSDNSKKIRFFWLLKDMNDDKKPLAASWIVKAGVTYTASFYKASGRVQVKVVGNHFLPRIEGEGECDVTP